MVFKSSDMSDDFSYTVRHGNFLDSTGRNLVHFEDDFLEHKQFAQHWAWGGLHVFIHICEISRLLL